MKDSVRRIHELIGRLSEATWARVETDPRNWPEKIFCESPPIAAPTTEREVAAWDAVTSPDNYEDFLEYQDYWNDTNLNEFALELHERILTEIQRRRDEQTP